MCRNKKVIMKEKIMKIVLLIGLVLSVFSSECMNSEIYSVYFSVASGRSMNKKLVAEIVDSNGESSREGSDLLHEQRIEASNGGIIVLFSKKNHGTKTVLLKDKTEGENFLEFTVDKPEEDVRSIVNLKKIASGLKASLYRPIMGGGDRFILTIGKAKEEESLEKFQSSQRYIEKGILISSIK